MRNLQLAVLLLLGTVSCVKMEHDNSAFYKKYVESFDNRTTIGVNIASAVQGEYYAVYYGNPYDEGSLVRQPALTGFTPIATTLEVPKDVRRLYVVGEGEVRNFAVGNLTIAPDARSAARTRAAEVNRIPAELVTAVNSIYFPEKPNNVRGENLFKCTDLKIAETPSTQTFETAEVWLTFLGDGGCRQDQLYGKLWFYTYPSNRMESLTTDDCTFYGVRGGEVVPISYADVRAKRNWIFYSKEEFPSNVASYKRYKLGEFPKGISVGFVYIGNSTVGNDGFRFTTPRLNPYVKNFQLTYQDDKKKFHIKDAYPANGFICHVTADQIEGNVLGMENRIVTEAKYDGDYNDMLCLVESNPKAIAPNDEVETGNSGKPEDIACKTSTGIYLFEDNYPSPGDFDFNDAVIRYEIKDYYLSKNQAKQITAEVLAIGAGMHNRFGFWNSKKFSCFFSDLKGYANVEAGKPFQTVGEPVTQTLYGVVEACLQNETGLYIYKTNFNTADYPCVLDIPLSDSDEASWQFEWPLEQASLDDAYYFLRGADGGERDGDWYRTPKDASQLYHR